MMKQENPIEEIWTVSGFGRSGIGANAPYFAAGKARFSTDLSRRVEEAR